MVELPFLYRVIERYEEIFRDLRFNREFQSPESVLMMIERLGVVVVEDRTYVAPFLMHENGNGGYDGRKILVYNPDVGRDSLVLQLGHELGHLICGHFEVKAFLCDRILSSRLEREADIVGYLCLIPTLEIQRRLEVSASMDYVFESLYQKLKTCDTDLRELERHLLARLRIFRAYQRVVNSFFPEKKGQRQFFVQRYSLVLR